MSYDFGDLSARGYECSPAGRARALQILRRLAPRDVRGGRMRRIGRDGDGGYVMLDDFAGITAAYSLGIDTDASWDTDIASRGIDVFQYDHTVAAPPEQHPRFHFNRCRIAGTDAPDGSSRSLPSLMRANGHHAGCDLVLKCDIEGGEYEAIGALETEHIRLFRQIVIEFHGLRDLHEPSFAALAGPVFAALTTHHAVVHVHGNNCGSYAITGGLPVPSVLEVTFVRRDDKVFAASRHPFPTHLDHPNNPAAADFSLGTFRF